MSRPSTSGLARVVLAVALLLLGPCGCGGPSAAGAQEGQRTAVTPTDPVPLPPDATPGRGEEQITDHGVRALEGGTTERLSVSVPADAISLTLEALGALGDTVGLGELIGPGGEVYENLALTGAYTWLPGAEAFSTTLPNTDRPEVQLVPGGGTYTFRMRSMAGRSTSLAVRAIVETRAPGDEDEATLDLNVWLAAGVAPTAATAAGDARLQDILSRVDAILSVQGVRLGAVDYYDVQETAFDTVEDEAEFGRLLQTTSAARETRLNLFFVRAAFGGGVVGAAATVCGPKRNGTTLSGVMSVYPGLSTYTIGLVAAHEIGHFTGLYHSVEQDGTHDFVLDTPECPANTTSASCPTLGGGLLMHWRAEGGTNLTPGQGLVLRAHPLLAPRRGGVGKPTPGLPGLAELVEALDLPAGWCATCRPARPAPGTQGAPAR